MELNKLGKLAAKTNKKKKVGRGYGSGKGGHTTGRGNKGQKARNTVAVGFEGGQISLYKRLPQMGGFKSHTAKKITGVTLKKLNVFKDGEEVTPEMLAERGIIRKVTKHGVKILATGELKKKVVLKGFLASENAKKAIEKAGAKLA